MFLYVSFIMQFRLLLLLLLLLFFHKLMILTDITMTYCLTLSMGLSVSPSPFKSALDAIFLLLFSPLKFLSHFSSYILFQPVCLPCCASSFDSIFFILSTSPWILYPFLKFFDTLLFCCINPLFFMLFSTIFCSSYCSKFLMGHNSTMQCLKYTTSL